MNSRRALLDHPDPEQRGRTALRLRVEMTNRTAVSQPLMTPKVYFLFLAMALRNLFGVLE